VTAQPQKKWSKWPLLVVALLGGHVTILVAIVTVATRDPSFAVMPNYYENAVHWDQSQAALRASAKLGWKLENIPSDTSDALGRRTVTFALADAAGKPVANAKVDVTAFHHSHATTPTQLSFTTGVDGKATPVVSIRHAGFWSFQCTAVAADGKTTFTETVTQYINPPRAMP
jgi:nitrogen fixation protein FixH